MSGLRHQDIATRFLNEATTSKYAGNFYIDSDTNLPFTYNSKTSAYEQIDEAPLLRYILTFLSTLYHENNITMAVTNDVYRQIMLRAKSFRSREESHLSFTNGIYSLKEHTLTPHSLSQTPDKNNIALLAFPFDLPTTTELPQPPTTFQNFLKTSFVLEDATHQTDQSLITVIQEMMGYFLYPVIVRPAVFFLTGSGANGKSVLGSLVMSLFPKHATSALSIEELTTSRFSGAMLITSRINVCSEEESKYLRSDKFKALSAGDSVKIEKKYAEGITFIPRTKYLFLTNNFPTFEGLDYGIKRRMNIIPMFRVFKPQECDNELPLKLQRELPEIVAWALQGLKRLQENNYVFSTYLSPACEKALQQFEDDSSSSVRFMREGYELYEKSDTTPDSDRSYVIINTLYDDYKTWCLDVGKKAVNKYSFGKELTKTLGLESKPRRSKESQLVDRVYYVKRRVETLPQQPLTVKDL